MEDVLSLIRNLAKIHNRNEKYLVEAVTIAKSYTAKEAMSLKIIDLIAPTSQDVLNYLKSKEKFTKNKQEIVIKSLTVETVEIPWQKQIILFLANPNLVYILMMIGIYGIIFEFMTPGGGVAGFIGFFCLVLALMGLSVISINAAGIVLIVAGIIMLILETVIFSHGLLAIGGILTLGAGSFLFFDSYPESFGFVRGVLIGISIVLGGFLFLIITKLSKLRKKETPFFLETKKIGKVVQDFVSGKGMVRIEGENWQAESIDELKKMDEVVVLKQNGMILVVGKKEGNSSDLK